VNRRRPPPIELARGRAADHPVGASSTRLPPQARPTRLTDGEGHGAVTTTDSRADREFIRQFEQVLRVLDALDYVDGWRLTPNGELLARMYSESTCSLPAPYGAALVGLDPAELAALMSCFTFERRGPDAGRSRRPPGRRAGSPSVRVSRSGAAVPYGLEQSNGLPETRRPDPGLTGRDARVGIGRVARPQRRRRTHRWRLRPSCEAGRDLLRQMDAAGAGDQGEAADAAATPASEASWLRQRHTRMIKPGDEWDGTDDAPDFDVWG
jgi:hypothetical protein